jgi:predicted Rossmann fold flavoprotein
MQIREKYDVVVIGAGAAGILAAGSAATSGARVLIIEKMRTPGKKILITGKGRCNITNMAPMHEFLTKVHPNPKFLRPALARFFSEDIIRLLRENGLETVVERGDRVFPVTDRSVDVLNALLRWLEKLRVEIINECQVNSIITEDGKVTGVSATDLSGSFTVTTKSVIVCTGGKSYPATGSTGDGYRLAESFGHHIEPTRQALVPLEVEGDTAAKMMGLSLKNVKAVLWVNGKKEREDFGEMLFTHFGLSGPIILTLSRNAVDALRAGHKTEISVDLKPALDEQKLDARLIRDLNENGKKQLENAFRLWLPSGMIPVFMELLSLDPRKLCNQVSGKERRKILLLMKELRFRITGCRSYKETVITAGGVRLLEIDPSTMESKLLRKLYFAGEVLDLDADTGGFNLQIAWSTGWLAGSAAAMGE